MSWSVSGTDITVDDIAALAPTYDLPSESVEQLRQAREHATALVESGVVGDNTKHFNVTLSGHANPDHEPTAGYANDMVSVSVSQAAAPAQTPGG